MGRLSKQNWLLLGLAATVVSGCANGPPTRGDLAYDPYEERNRFFHEFNVDADSAFIQPAQRMYDFATPTLVQHLVSNAIDHLSLPGVFVNDLLQGEFEQAGETLARFGVNTLVGAGGLLDPATEAGLLLEPNDFGVTLASYGVEEGGYLVLPLFGPSTVRDAIGRAVDIAFSPTTYIGIPVEAAGVGAGITAVTVIDARNRNAEVLDEILHESLDSYVTLRSIYLQNRRRQVAGETADVESLPDIFSQ